MQALDHGIYGRGTLLMSSVDLVWATPNADQMIGYMARVSNVNAKPEDDAVKLIRYLVKHWHWSPFEMANMCVEISTTRDISRQILRHRSLHFQEFSQRYAVVPPSIVYREPRLQDSTNRQNSIPLTDLDDIRHDTFASAQYNVWETAYSNYLEALDSGIAKEQARALLPEGLTSSLMFVNGTIRDWLFYVGVRKGNGTQAEHVEIAEGVKKLLFEVVPNTAEAFFAEHKESA